MNGGESAPEPDSLECARCGLVKIIYRDADSFLDEVLIHLRHGRENPAGH